jgi:DNA polymerase-3 subunit delta
LLKEARVWGPRQAPFRRALQRLQADTVNTALTDAARIDRLIKGIEIGEIWNDFLRLGLRLCAR